VGLLESACGRPQASAFGEDAYPTVWEKAAALLQSLACNHAFVQGNKRTAWMATVVFLWVNGHRLDSPLDEDAGEALVLSVATGTLRDVTSIASALIKFVR
jgi:death-on-curing protein